MSKDGGNGHLGCLFVTAKSSLYVRIEVPLKFPLQKRVRRVKLIKSLMGVAFPSQPITIALLPHRSCADPLASGVWTLNSSTFWEEAPWPFIWQFKAQTRKLQWHIIRSSSNPMTVVYSFMDEDDISF
ncbi:predicted protein [Coccidioides posadasii str. Silveira]|uniref:Predicted protein n=1 Tax=Coccidioides posadasii (strain RMSCC 757 / Silveira) TaxID=443226 RepID=E9DFK8_COCPS|nr:predicted protein [Coccidioides posadasii str. Silveira]